MSFLRRKIVLTDCPVEGCDGQRRQGQLFCRACWFRLPVRLRREVSAAWSFLRRAKGAELTPAAVEYRLVRSAALKAAGETAPWRKEHA